MSSSSWMIEWRRKRRDEIRESGAIALEMFTEIGCRFPSMDIPRFDWSFLFDDVEEDEDDQPDDAVVSFGRLPCHAIDECPNPKAREQQTEQQGDTDDDERHATLSSQGAPRRGGVDRESGGMSRRPFGSPLDPRAQQYRCSRDEVCY